MLCWHFEIWFHNCYINCRRPTVVVVFVVCVVVGDVVVVVDIEISSLEVTSKVDVTSYVEEHEVVIQK